MLDDDVHVEVRKLYQDAEVPTFDYQDLSDNRMLFIYQSSRPLADCAHGLIEGCIEHFGETMKIERNDLPVATGAHTEFILHAISDAKS